MAGLKGKSGPPDNMNAFKHGLAAIQKRRDEGVPTEHEETVPNRPARRESIYSRRSQEPKAACQSKPRRRSL